MPETVRAASSGGRRRRASGTDGDPLCPICLDCIRHSVETNCAHLFCAECLFTHREQGEPLQPMLCPLCRQQVTLLFVCFTDTELASAEPEAVEARSAARRDVASYNRRFSGLPRPWMEHLRDVPCLLRHLWLEFFSVRGMLFMFRVRIVMCFLMAAAYLLMPFDILPEAVFGAIGLLDDLFIVLALLVYASVLYRHYVAAQD